MKTLPAAILSAKNKIDQASPWLILADIDLQQGTVLYLVNNNEDVTFNSHVYTALGFEVIPPREASKGEIPTVTLSISNVTRSIQAYMEALAGAVGAVVTLRIVNAGLLAEDYAELTMTFDVIASKCNATNATFTLGAPNPLNSRFPEHQYIAMHCNWKFKGCECAYAGADATCTRSWTDCRTKGNSNRFGGFPGLSGGIRIV